jgi:hypothetical protein
MASVGWKKPGTLPRVDFEKKISAVLGDGGSLSRFELERLSGPRTGRWSEQNEAMFTAALRSMVRRGVIVCEGRYRLAPATPVCIHRACS